MAFKSLARVGVAIVVGVTAMTTSVGGLDAASQEPRAPRCMGRVVTVNLALGQRPTNGNDVILGTQGPDEISAGRGNDWVCARGGNDIVHAGPGHDRVRGGPGHDTLNLGSGNDYAWGEEGRDLLRGQTGWDYLLGGPGNNRYQGGPGFDICGRDQNPNHGDRGCEAYPGE